MHDITKLEEQISELERVLDMLGDKKRLEELRSIIHRPGWTTLPEYRLVSGALTGLTAHANASHNLFAALMEGSRSIGNSEDSSPDPIPA